MKPEYDAGKNLKEQMESAVELYDSEMSLQSIADALNLNPIKVRKLLITAGVYESDVAEKVKNTFEEYRETRDYKTSILTTSSTLQLSKASVTSYLPYQKGVYFPSTEKEKISVGAERQRRYRAMKWWRVDPTEENFWSVVLAYAGVKFKTYSGLSFTYEIKKGRNGEYTKELWIENSDFFEVPPPKFKRLTLGSEVRLMGAYLVRCTGVDKDENGKVVAIHAEADLETRNGNPADGRKVRGTIHWVSCAHCLDAEVELYDKLFTEANMNSIPDDADFKDYLNPDSVKVLQGAKLEESLKDAKPGDRFQFVRNGYFTPDSKHEGVYNRIVTLKDSFKL